MADNSKVLIQQAKQLVESGQFEHAVALLDQALQQNPRRANGWFLRGVALTQMQRFDQAVESYSHALTVNPKLAKVWYFKARSEYDQSLFAAAADSCRQGLAVVEASSPQLNESLTTLLQQSEAQQSEEPIATITPMAQQPEAAATPPVSAAMAGGDDSDDGDEDGPQEEPFQRDEPGEESEMDMTPMVDVTFLLLIFFMVTAAFNLQKSLVIPTPKPDESSTSQQPPEEDPDTLTIHVDDLNSYHIVIGDEEQDAQSEHELYRQVRRLVNASNKSAGVSKLIVVAHEEALHGKIVTALDAGMAVGMQQIQLRTVDDNEF